MPNCPICGDSVADARGLAAHFRHQASTHPDYRTWKADQRWEGKVEGEDYVRCLVCGHRAATLARHLKAVHSITADEYREAHPGALIRPSKVTAKRRAALKASRGSDAYGGTKEVACPSCGSPHAVHKLAGRLHDLRCPACKEAVWEDLSEPEDYVTCLECGHRAENLTSHVVNAHPGYREAHPEAPLVALRSAVRDKESLRGRELSQETRRRMSENAGRWNAGLTKETDECVAAAAEKMRGCVPWSKGLTVAEHPSLQATVEKLRAYVGENRPWHNGMKAELTLEDFGPFLDEEGYVDRRAIQEALGLSWRTIFTYMGTLGLETSSKYVRERSEAQVIRLEADELRAFAYKNGKVAVGRAMVGLGHSFPVIKRECERHGLETAGKGGLQAECLEAVKAALGGVSYKEEWRSKKFLSPKGHRFRFDGYFREANLVVEYHGYQHFVFPNRYMPDESYRPEYERMREYDRLKREMVAADPALRYLMVRYDEPHADVGYLRYRLVKIGVLTPERARELDAEDGVRSRDYGGDVDVFDLFSY